MRITSHILKVFHLPYIRRGSPRESRSSQPPARALATRRKFLVVSFFFLVCARHRRRGRVSARADRPHAGIRGQRLERRGLVDGGPPALAGTRRRGHQRQEPSRQPAEGGLQTGAASANAARRRARGPARGARPARRTRVAGAHSPAPSAAQRAALGAARVHRREHAPFALPIGSRRRAPQTVQSGYTHTVLLVITRSIGSIPDTDDSSEVKSRWNWQLQIRCTYR